MKRPITGYFSSHFIIFFSFTSEHADFRKDPYWQDHYARCGVF